MTRIDLSPEQLNAQAAGRIEPGPSLFQALEDLHYDYLRECEIDYLTQLGPPVTRTRIREQLGNRTIDYIEIVPEPADANGRNLSGPMVSLIGGVKEERSEAGYSHRHHPVRAALTLWERRCRRYHRQVPGRAPMWRDHADGPVCAELAWSVIAHGTSLRWAAEQAEVEFPRAERLLAEAVRYMRGQMERWEDLVETSVHDVDACDICRREAG